MSDAKIADELLAQISTIKNDGTEKKIPVIITLNENSDIHLVTQKLTEKNISVTSSFTEPIMMIRCSLSPIQTEQVSELSEIKKIELDGSVFPQ